MEDGRHEFHLVFVSRGYGAAPGLLLGADAAVPHELPHAAFAVLYTMGIIGGAEVFSGGTEIFRERLRRFLPGGPRELNLHTEILVFDADHGVLPRRLLSTA